ncbi:MAG: hypothetical protein ACJ77D_04905 [Chloroflexota bacterium]
MTGVSAMIDQGSVGDDARVSRWLTKLASVLAVVAIAIAIGIVRLGTSGDPVFQVGLDVSSIAPVMTTVLFPLVGALIVQRRPRTRVAWLLIAMGLGLGFGFLSYGYGAIGVPPPPVFPFALQAIVISQFFLVPFLATGTPLLLLLFPSDSLLSPRWRWVAVLSFVGLAAYLVGTVFRPGALADANFPDLPNPLGLPVSFTELCDQLVIVGNAVMLTAVALSATSLVLRYRRGDIVEQAQIRWIALSGAFVAAAFVVASFQITPISDWAWALGFAFLSCLPIAIGVAVTRYRLYEIDRLINRTLVYGSLTAILAGIFTAGIGLAQRVFIATTGENSDAAIVLATLVVATLYAPLRKRLEGVIDRRFKYEHLEFGAYRDEVTRILAVLEPKRAADRLVREAVRELEAAGGAVVDAADQPIATAGTWPIPAVVRLPIAGRGPLRAVLVGPRTDGRPHDPLTLAQLEDIAELVASAVRIAAQPAQPAPETPG